MDASYRSTEDFINDQIEEALEKYQRWKQQLLKKLVLKISVR
jgi:hypothetical protein